MRFNHFLPFLKRAERSPGQAGAGGIRRFLKRLGPTWLSSPVRRLIQAVCFALFLWLFFYVCWPYGSRDYSADMSRREFIPAASFLAIDPLVSLSTALAARAWVWSLAWASGVLLVCMLAPRGFCGYLCPLGTLIDLFDWAVGKRVKRFRVKHDCWWVNLKYYLLLAVLICCLSGILVSGFVAAIPVITRGFLFVLGPVQMGTLRGFYQVPAMNAGHWFSIALFAAVLGLGLLRPRFWCRHVCPTGALFSLGNLFRATERKVEESCINCGKCVSICPFDAIKADFTTRTADCTFCQTCGGVCPTQAIKFVNRGDLSRLKKENDPPVHEIPISRRGLLSGLAAGLASSFLVRLPPGARPPAVIRPPGSVPEDAFLELCIRCGECFKACPNNVLQPMGFEGGLNNLWTPQAVPSWSGCEPSCNDCGRVCPTGAIRALPIAEKRVARMGLAIIDRQTCLPHAGREACKLCVDECNSAGYSAIEFERVHGQTDPQGNPVEDSGFLAPVVVADKCVGCGMCQTRCGNVNFKTKGLLRQSAVIIRAGGTYETRLATGSYLELRKRQQEASDKSGTNVPYKIDY